MIELPKRLEPLFNDPAREQVIVAHRRWAKTLYQVSKSILGTKHHRGALTKKNGLFWIVFPTYRQAKLAAWKMLLDLAAQTKHLSRKDETGLKVEFDNGSQVWLKGSDDPDSLRGAGLDGCSLDEWALQRPEIFTEIIRPALADKKGWSIKAFTPKGRNHAHDDFILSGQKYFFPADKTGVLDEEELAALRKEQSADEFAQEMLCQFLYHAGQIYREFRPEVHVIAPRDLTGCSEHISIDYGLRNPTCVLFSKTDYDGNIYITDEIYKSGLEVSDHAINIRKIFQSPSGVIDPSTAAKTRVKNGIPYSIYQEFCDNGISLTLAPNQVIGGINLVKQYLTDKKLFIFDRCENLIREMQDYRWKEKRSNEQNLPEEPLKANDHAVDALRYLLASKYLAPKQITKINIPELCTYNVRKMIREKNSPKGVGAYAIVDR